MDAPDRPVLLYDDGCRFCRASAEAVLRWDRAGRVALLPWSHPRAVVWMHGLTPAERDASMHIALPDGVLLHSGDAMILLFDALPGLHWLGALARRSDTLRDCVGWGYGVAARNRETLSRLVPNRPPVERHPGTG